MPKTFFWMKMFFWIWFFASVGQAVLLQSPEYLAITAHRALLTVFLWFVINEFRYQIIARLDCWADREELHEQIKRLEEKIYKK